MNTLFADTLKKLRAKKGLSQIELAKEMFVNKPTISRWENGHRLPDAKFVIFAIEDKSPVVISRIPEALGLIDPCNEIRLGMGQTQLYVQRKKSELVLLKILLVAVVPDMEFQIIGKIGIILGRQIIDVSNMGNKLYLPVVKIVVVFERSCHLLNRHRRKLDKIGLFQTESGKNREGDDISRHQNGSE